MPGRQKTSAYNTVTAATMRGLRGEKKLTFAELESATGIKEAQLERLFRNEATFSAEDFTTIAIALGENPAALVDVILAKVRVQ